MNILFGDNQAYLIYYIPTRLWQVQTYSGSAQHSMEVISTDQGLEVLMSPTIVTDSETNKGTNVIITQVFDMVKPARYSFLTVNVEQPLSCI